MTISNHISTGFPYAALRRNTQDYALLFHINYLVDRPQISGTIGKNYRARSRHFGCALRTPDQGPLFANQEVGMNTTTFLDLTIEKRGRQYFVVLTDNIEVNQVGPFKRKKEALKLYRQLARQALALGGRRQPAIAKSAAADAQGGAA